MIASLNLNIFARHADRVRMANIAQMVNVLQAMILTDGPRMVLTPTYHVFRMYLPFQDATSVPVSFAAGWYMKGDVTLPRLDAIAAKDKRRQALGRGHQPGSDARGDRRAGRARREVGARARRDAGRAQGRQRQHLRQAQGGGAEADRRAQRRRKAPA